MCQKWSDILWVALKLESDAEVYLGYCQASMMDVFARANNSV